jgi:hypothetical protein
MTHLKKLRLQSSVFWRPQNIRAYTICLLIFYRRLLSSKLRPNWRNCEKLRKRHSMQPWKELIQVSCESNPVFETLKWQALLWASFLSPDTLLDYALSNLNVYVFGHRLRVFANCPFPRGGSTLTCDISSRPGGVSVICDLLGFEKAQNGSFLPTCDHRNVGIKPPSYAA